jgi:hypothetical protein
VLRIGGYAWIAVPPYPEGVGCRNHYSCFPKPVWYDMFNRAGFVMHREGDSFGDWAFMLRKRMHLGMVERKVEQ